MAGFREGMRRSVLDLVTDMVFLTEEQNQQKNPILLFNFTDAVFGP